MKKPTGKLTPYLQREFGRLCPKGWSCRHEEHVLSKQFEQTLGYAARADVLLQSEDSPCRYWIEFEVSRADPVANHAKFATAHLFTPQVPEDVFVSMVSPHVARGRRNLAANAISLMRCVGMNAFQTVLFPHKTRDEIKLLNAMPNADLDAQNLPIKDEIQRVFAITQSVASIGMRRIHLVGDLTEVLLNLRQFNLDMATEEGQSQFDRRTVTYFVYDRATKQFAPSKFCAYVAIPQIASETHGDLASRFRAKMTTEFYANLDETDPNFDGCVARIHLEKQLAMQLRQLTDIPGLQPAFADWTNKHRNHITIHPNGPKFLLPPEWF
jgi:hypothetical protein